LKARALLLFIVLLLVLLSPSIMKYPSLVGASSNGANSAHHSVTYESDCNGYSSTSKHNYLPNYICTEPLWDSDNGYYVGHNEPAVKFYSSTPGSGYNLQWNLTLPATDPTPTQSGSSVANFELYETIWLGLALCDPNSYPFGACTPDSDSNGLSAGSAFMELQLYPPYLSSQYGCSPTQWCAALTIDSYTLNGNCLEPINFAFVTTTGVPGGSPLLMNIGDKLFVTLEDTSNGLLASINDQSNGQVGSMVASSANGFQNTNPNTCATSPFSFRPEFTTAGTGNYVPWTAESIDVSLAFETGHFELGSPPDSSDQDDLGCVVLHGITGCEGADLDYDGVPFTPSWPDGSINHPSPLIIGSPSGKGMGPESIGASTYSNPYTSIKFITEAVGGTFYPFYSETTSCTFVFGNDIPGVTVNDFGKSAQYSASTIANPCQPSSLLTIPVGSGPEGVAYDATDGNIYVTNEFSGTVSVISSNTNAVTSTVVVGNSPLFDSFIASKTSVYATNYGSSTISIIKSGVVTSTLKGFNGPLGVVSDPANGRIYVANAGSDTLSVLNAKTNLLVRTITVSGSPDYLAYDPSNKDVYASIDGTSNTVVVINSNNAIIKTIPVGNTPQGIVYDPTNHNIYVVNLNSNTVSVISSATNTIVATLSVGQGPFDAAYDGSTHNVYVTNGQSNSVSEISSSTNSVVKTIGVGNSPIGIAFDAKNHNLYVADYGQGTVSVIPCCI